MKRLLRVLGSTKNHVSDARKLPNDSNQPRNWWLSRFFSSLLGKKDIWVVPLLLRKFTHAVHKPEGFAKIWELECLSEVVLVYHIPSIHLLLQRGEFLTLQRWDAATA